MLSLLLSLFLAVRTQKLENMREKFKKLRDDSTELNLLLNKKNRYLMEKQETEIHLATLKERNRIAREIHDNVGHMLSRSILQLGALKALNHDSSLSAPLSELHKTLNTAMDLSLIHILCYDIYAKKQLIEKMIDNFYTDSPEKEKKEKKMKK